MAALKTDSVASTVFLMEYEAGMPGDSPAVDGPGSSHASVPPISPSRDSFSYYEQPDDMDGDRSSADPIVMPKASDSSEQLVRPPPPPKVRRMNNPLYVPGPEEMPGYRPPSERSDSQRCLGGIVCFISLVAISALILTVLMMAGKISPPEVNAGPKYAQLISPYNSTHLDRTLQRIEELEIKQLELQKQFSALQDTVATDEDLKALSKNVSLNAAAMEENWKNIGNINKKVGEIDTYHQTVNEELFDLDRRMVDLNGCGTNVYTSKTRADQAHTDFDITQLNATSVILGVTCASDNGKSANFMRSPEGDIYRCKCQDIINANKDMTCSMYIWYCKRNLS